MTASEKLRMKTSLPKVSKNFWYWKNLLSCGKKTVLSYQKRHLGKICLSCYGDFWLTLNKFCLEDKVLWHITRHNVHKTSRNTLGNILTCYWHSISFVCQLAYIFFFEKLDNFMLLMRKIFTAKNVSRYITVILHSNMNGFSD